MTDSDTYWKFLNLQVENEGMERAYQTLSTADLVLLVIDSMHYIKWIRDNSISKNSLKEFLFLYIQELKLENTILSFENIESLCNFNETKTKTETRCLIVFNKIDLIEGDAVAKVCDQYPNIASAICCGEHVQLTPLMTHLEDQLKFL